MAVACCRDSFAPEETNIVTGVVSCSLRLRLDVSLSNASTPQLASSNKFKIVQDNFGPQIAALFDGRAT